MRAPGVMLLLASLAAFAVTSSTGAEDEWTNAKVQKTLLAKIVVSCPHALAARMGGLDTSAPQANCDDPTAPKLDGVYHVSATRDEKLAIDPSCVGLSTYSEATLVFDRGWLRLWREGDVDGDAFWWSGSFSLQDDGSVVMRVAAAGYGNASNPIRPPFTMVLGYNVSRDQLTFSVVPVTGLVASPRCFALKPWRRIAEAPSMTFKTPKSALVGTWSNGRRVVVLDGRRFSLGTKAAKPTRKYTYEVLGDAIRFRTPYAQFWEYTWNINSGLLELTHPPYGGWNRELTRKPWRRVGR
jgi:hypothetical protein